MTEMDSSWQENIHSLKEKNAYIFENQIMCDCCLEVEGEVDVEQIFAHRLFLSMNSCKFEEMLKKQTEGVSNASHLHTYKITDVKHETLYKLVKFFYTEEVELDSYVSARDLLLAAIKFQTRAIVDKCVDAINDFMCPETVLDVLKLALELKNGKLEEECLRLIRKETSRVLKSEYFETSESDILERIYECEYLKIESEMELYRALLRWAPRECERRGLPQDNESLRRVSLPLLQKIRFLSFTAKQVSELRESPLLPVEEAFDILVAINDPLRTTLENGFTAVRNPRNTKLEEKCEYFYNIIQHEYKDNNIYVKELEFQITKTITIVGIKVHAWIIPKAKIIKGADTFSSQPPQSTSIDLNNHTWLLPKANMTKGADTFASQSTQPSPTDLNSHTQFGSHVPIFSGTVPSFGTTGCQFPSPVLFGQISQGAGGFGSTSLSGDNKLTACGYTPPTPNSSNTETFNSFSFRPRLGIRTNGPSLSSKDTSSNLHSGHNTTQTRTYVFCVSLLHKTCGKIIACKHFNVEESHSFELLSFRINAPLKQSKKYCIKVLYFCRDEHSSAQQIVYHVPLSEDCESDNVTGNMKPLKYDVNWFVKSIYYKKRYPYLM